MESNDLTTEQAQQMHQSLFRLANYLSRVVKRMERTGFPPSDPLYQSTKKAYDAVCIQAFMAQLLGVSPESIQIAHLKKDAVWSVDGNALAEQAVAATAEFGTARANALWLLELALNMKTPVIYDVIHRGDREERIVNEEATMAAKEKQKVIKEKFRSTVFEDPERAERLVRLYNDTYNNLRPRLFDGSHLEFPGMNCTIGLRPHQKDAVWRGMSSGNVLLAHAVGAGKTFVMAATGMKLKQAGLVKKPMYVVPTTCSSSSPASSCSSIPTPSSSWPRRRTSSVHAAST